MFPRRAGHPPGESIDPQRRGRLHTLVERIKPVIATLAFPLALVLQERRASTDFSTRSLASRHCVGRSTGGDAHTERARFHARASRRERRPGGFALGAQDESGKREYRQNDAALGCPLRCAVDDPRRFHRTGPAFCAICITLPPSNVLSAPAAETPAPPPLPPRHRGGRVRKPHHHLLCLVVGPRAAAVPTGGVRARTGDCAPRLGATQRRRSTRTDGQSHRRRAGCWRRGRCGDSGRVHRAKLPPATRAGEGGGGHERAQTRSVPRGRRLHSAPWWVGHVGGAGRGVVLASARLSQQADCVIQCGRLLGSADMLAGASGRVEHGIDRYGVAAAAAVRR
eukprot:ctg_3057.g540